MKIAAAAGVSPEVVLRLAGLLPKPPDWSPALDELATLFEQLPEDDQDELLSLARMKAQKVRGARAKPTSPRVRPVSTRAAGPRPGRVAGHHAGEDGKD
ncbi:MAG: hypothetical protein NZM11_00820 [Anaerolineales bacterium]|nr:hypothetical protein [Anaerolineales bacterium]